MASEESVPGDESCRPTDGVRRPMRLPGYDYSQAGAYFVTICTHERTCIFGDIAGGTMELNDLGRTVQQAWDGISGQHPAVISDAFVIMPNHVHGIVAFGGEHGASSKPGAMNRAPTLGSIVRGFKGAATFMIQW